MSTFTGYQLQAELTAIYPGMGDKESYEGLAYVTMGLAGEAGEVVGKVKKILRDNGGIIGDVARAQILDEAGDVLWYLAMLTRQLGVPLAAVAEGNLAKLADRAERGVLQGSGDTR